jgi:hypothetical protein
MERDPEQALDDIREDVAEGDEPEPDEQAFLEGERADPTPGVPDDAEPPDRF